MRHFLFTFLALILLNGSLVFADADYTSTCADFAAPLTGGYCVHIPTHHRSRDIVYHLHGRGGSQADWQDSFYYTQQIRTEWKKRRARLPVVISVSFGQVWLLAEKNASPYSGLFEVFTQQVMPQLENAVGGLRGRRIIFGESMGGFNTSQLALKTNLFNKAAILCAPMSDVSPFAPVDEIKSHIEKSSAYDYYKKSEPDLVLNTTLEIAQLVQAFMPTEADYARANPLNLVQTSRSRTMLYIAAGFYDKYALYEGNEKFASLLTARRRHNEWRPQWGGHCAMDIPSLARFLVN